MTGYIIGGIAGLIVGWYVRDYIASRQLRELMDVSYLDEWIRDGKVKP